MMEKRIALSLLMDFYGPLLTEHRRKVTRMYCDEDMTLQEIADQLGVSRQGVHEAIKVSEGQLRRYEEILGIVERYRGIRREVAFCRGQLAKVEANEASRAALQAAIDALERIEWIEK